MQTREVIDRRTSFHLDWQRSRWLARCSLAPTAVRAQEAPEYGPAKGTLVIVGGGTLQRRRHRREVHRAGGRQGREVRHRADRRRQQEPGRHRSRPTTRRTCCGRGRRAGSPTSACCTRPIRKWPNTAEFVKPLHDANAVWFEGGRQWNIVDSYANTLDLQGVPPRARARWRDRRLVGRRHASRATSSCAARSQGSQLDRRAGARTPQGVRVPAPERDRSAHQHPQPLGRHRPADQGPPGAARHRSLREHGDRRARRSVRGDRRVEGGGARQHARLSAVGEAVLRAVGRRRLQHEDAEDREARHRRRAARDGDGAGPRAHHARRPSRPATPPTEAR